MKVIKLSAILIICSALSYCSASITEVNDPNPEPKKERKCQVDDETRSVVGAWDWVESSGGFDGKTKTSQSEGETRRIVFDEEGQYSYYIDDKLIDFSNYSLGESKTIYSATEEPVIFFNEDAYPTYVYSFSESGELLLVDNFYDGYGHTYVLNCD